jgi:DNA-directed RNA polymerase subunit RPC12/RpoP
MTRVWVCDKCGQQFEHKEDEKGNFQVWDLTLYEAWEPIATLCSDCRNEFDLLINTFFGKRLLIPLKEIEK